MQILIVGDEKKMAAVLKKELEVSGWASLLPQGSARAASKFRPLQGSVPSSQFAYCSCNAGRLQLGFSFPFRRFTWDIQVTVPCFVREACDRLSRELPRL